MKKIVTLALTLMFCLGMGSALAADYTAQNLYTVSYDESFILDTSFAQPDGEGEIWLFSLTKDDLVLEAVKEKIEGKENYGMLTATPQEEQDYLEGIYNYFADQKPEFLGTTKSQKDGIPFYLFSLEDAEGTYYYADTMVKGTSIGFYAYYKGVGVNADEALLDQLTLLLESYVPVAS